MKSTAEVMGIDSTFAMAFAEKRNSQPSSEFAR